MSNATGATFTPMTELDGVLRGPDGKATADRLITRIDQLTEEIEAHKRAGLSADDYSRVEAINKALAEARSIVLWFRANHN